MPQLNVDFNANPLTVCVGQPVQFTDLSTSSAPIVSWAWDFGDGSSNNTQNPTHTYNTAGTFTVILTASNGTSAVSEVKSNYIVVNPLPEPSFTLSNPPCSLPASLNVTSVNPASGVSYNWDFGNGQTSTQAQPSNINFPNAGNYTISLTVTNTSTGCTNTTTQTISINNYSTSFTLSPSTVCVGSPVSFTNNSPPGTNSFSWDFGNGQSSSEPNPSHIYTSAGTYSVTLTSQNTSIGCSAQSTQTVTVLNAQQPSLEPSLTIGCNPETVSFTNTSDFNGTFSWDFGNGNTFDGNNPPPQNYTMPNFDEFPNPESQSFTVIIYATDANGCATGQAYPDLITIYNLFPNFDVDVFEGCETLMSTFTDDSFSPIPGFPINSWNWSFGNGQTSNQQNPPTQAYNEGVYDVSLTVTTANGCTATLDSLSAIQVGIPPNVLFTVEPDTICARQTLEFVNLTTIDVPFEEHEVEYTWMIGNQGPFSVFEPNSEPVLDTGYIDITLIVSFRGCMDTLILENVVYVLPPLIDFSVPNVVCNPDLPAQITIQDDTILGQEDDNVAVFWWLGDGTTYDYNSEQAWLNNQTSFTHSYQNYGDFVVKQKAWNFENGCIDSLEFTVSINFFELILNVLTDSVCWGEASSFSISHESIAFYPMVLFSYTANDSLLGFSNSGAVTNPQSYVYPNPGLNQIFAQATNQLGCISSASQSVYVAPWPDVQIELNSVLGCVPTQATFEDASVSLSGVPLTSYQWSSDGTAVSPENEAIYIVGIEETGTFAVNLTVTDALGCSASTTLTTEFISPIANFEIPEVVCNNAVFSPQNLSENFSSSEWYWNNQLLSSENNPELTFNFPDDPNVSSYNEVIKLIVSDGLGCFDEIEIPIIISAPYANFSYQLTGANTDELGNFTCPSVFGQFTDLSQSFGDIVSWSWDFGDGKTSVFQNPSNTYVFAGTYTSSLTITDEYGCESTMVFEDFLVINGPTGEFGWIPGGTACDPNYIFEVYELNNATQIQWYPGDGTSFSSITGGEYFYPSAGTFGPFVVISDDNNCSVLYPLDSLNVQFGNLNAAFAINSSELNWGENLTIWNQSTGGIGGIISNEWFIGNDSFTNNQSQFNYLFNESGQLNITLIVTDSLGCVDTAFASVFVTTQLAFPNVFTPNGDGSNDVFTFVYNAYREYEVVILNRWGNVMSRKYVVDENYLWDGRAPNGEIASEGVYYYLVKGILRDNTEREDYGFFHLILK